MKDRIWQGSGAILAAPATKSIILNTFTKFKLFNYLLFKFVS